MNVDYDAKEKIYCHLLRTCDLLREALVKECASKSGQKTFVLPRSTWKAFCNYFEKKIR